jgi:hypothetical protein
MDGAEVTQTCATRAIFGNADHWLSEEGEITLPEGRATAGALALVLTGLEDWDRPFGDQARIVRLAIASRTRRPDPPDHRTRWALRRIGRWQIRNCGPP